MESRLLWKSSNAKLLPVHRSGIPRGLFAQHLSKLYENILGRWFLHRALVQCSF